MMVGTAGTQKHGTRLARDDLQTPNALVKCNGTFHIRRVELTLRTATIALITSPPIRSGPNDNDGLSICQLPYFRRLSPCDIIHR